MSEWIDFCVYALQSVVLWILLPRWGAPFARYMLEDRNPAWADAHPDEVGRLARGGRLLPLLYAWSIFGVAVLLVIRLGLLPDLLRWQHPGTPSWEVLQNAANALLLGGILIMGIGFATSMRWLNRNVPLAERRQASLAPRTTGQYAPRWALWLVCGVSVVHLLAWLIFGLSDLPHDRGYWPATAGMFGMTMVLFATLRYGVLRRPNHYDRALGPVYRQTEIRAYLAMLLLMPAMGLIGLYRALTGFDTDRMASLVIALFVIATTVSLIRLPRAESNPVNRSTSLRSGAITMLLVPLLVPLALVALQPASVTVVTQDALLEVELQPDLAVVRGDLALTHEEHPLGGQLA